jgi:hypothetical protein
MRGYDRDLDAASGMAADEHGDLTLVEGCKGHGRCDALNDSLLLGIRMPRILTSPRD